MRCFWTGHGRKLAKYGCGRRSAFDIAKADKRRIAPTGNSKIGARSKKSVPGSSKTRQTSWPHATNPKRVKSADMARFASWFVCTSLAALPLYGCSPKSNTNGGSDGITATEHVPAHATTADATATEQATATATPTATQQDGSAAGTASIEAENETAKAKDSHAEAEETAAAQAEVPAVVDVASLLKQVRSTKTSDIKAKAALETAKKAQAKPADLVAASVARAEQLLGTPDRAVVFLDWAEAQGTKSAEVPFTLAKLAAMAGEVSDCKTQLQAVKDRGGKALLKKVGFDPIFNVVADDPEIRMLIK